MLVIFGVHCWFARTSLWSPLSQLLLYRLSAGVSSAIIMGMFSFQSRHCLSRLLLDGMDSCARDGVETRVSMLTVLVWRVHG